MSRISELFESVRISLLSYGDPEQAERSRRRLRTSFRVLGVEPKQLRQLASDYYTSSGHRFHLDRLYPFLKDLWNSDVWEEKMLALAILSQYREEYDWDLFDYLSRWTEDLDDATLTDALGHELARLIRLFPQKVKMVQRWVESPKPWRRRLAAVSLFLPKAEEGKHLVTEVDQALRVAEALVSDSSVPVQKGLAQLLKYVGRDAPEALQEFVAAHSDSLSKVVRKSLSAR